MRLAPTRERAAPVIARPQRIEPRQTGSSPPDEPLALIIIGYLAAGVEPLAQLRVVEPPRHRDADGAKSGHVGRRADHDNVPPALDTVELIHFAPGCRQPRNGP